MESSREFEFNNGEVIVTVRDQEYIEARQGELVDLEKMTDIPTGFVPFRQIINLILIDKRNPSEELMSFEPGIDIRIRYKGSDQAAAAAVRRELSLGFYKDSEWIRFTERKHNLLKVPDADPQNGGWFTVTVSLWGDPPIAIGT